MAVIARKAQAWMSSLTTHVTQISCNVTIYRRMA
ncbi:MAG: hypothetical protein OJF47_001216 [Nitrospira sp.]|nr:MAG: hypothetical protein OJF47_001216 [Nitrospira sp.]